MSKTARTRSRSNERTPLNTIDEETKSQPILRICGAQIKNRGYPSHKTSCSACREHDEQQAFTAEKISSLAAVVSRLQTEMAKVVKDMAKAMKEIQTLRAQSRTQLSEIKQEMKETAKEINQKSITPLQDPTTELTISGLPYAGKQEDLKEIITKIAALKNVTLPSTVKYFRAIKKRDSHSHNPNKPPKVILQLHDNNLKNEMKKRGQTQLTLRNLQHECKELSGEQLDSQFFMNENLNPEQAKLNYQSRQLKKKLKYKYAWTKDGISLLRKAENEPIHSIRSAQDLQQLEESEAAKDRQ